MTTPIYRPLRQAETKERLDIGTWPGFDKIRYDLDVEGRGQALAGPFTFGRAFDSPPFFTFSAVATVNNQGRPAQLTVGVAEWVRDEQNMYVGAHLWFKFEVCQEQFPSGLVLEEDFETIIDRQGGGPEGNEIIAFGRLALPGINGDGFYWPSAEFIEAENSVADAVRLVQQNKIVEGRQFAVQFATGPEAISPFFVSNTSTPAPVFANDVNRTSWFLETANPYKGTRHARQIQPAHTFPAQFVQNKGGLYLADSMPCTVPEPETGLDKSDPNDPFKDVTVRPFIQILEGMTLKVSAFMMVDNIDDVINRQMAFSVSFYDENADFIGLSLNNAVSNVLQLSYTKHEMELPIVPTDPDTEPFFPTDMSLIRYITLQLQYLNVTISRSYTQKIVDVDNIRVEVIGPSQTVRKPAFQLALRFQGQFLQGYGNIHKVDKKAAPVKVVLT